MLLDCHRKVELASYMTPLNRYRNQTISKQVLAIAWYSASADDFDTFVCFIDFHEIIEEPRKMQYPDTDLRVVRQSHNKLSMSDYFRMAIAILVVVIL